MMIELQEFKGLNEKQFLERIFREKTENIEIYIPKSTSQFFSTNEDIAIDYLHLAYAGELLF